MKIFVKSILIITLTITTILPATAQTVDGGWSRFLDDSSRSILQYTVADDGVVTVALGRSANHISDRWKASVGYWYTSRALRDNISYTYVFEAWTQTGNRNLTVEYFKHPESNRSLTADISITNERRTYTITGLALPPNGNKFIAFQCGDLLGTFFVRIVEIREARSGEVPLERDRWSRFAAHDSTATLAFSIARDDVVTVDVGGRTDSEPWKAQTRYYYTAKANTRYTYVFEAWAQRGNRNLFVGSLWDNEENRYKVAENFTLTNRRTTYTITGQSSSRDGVSTIDFHSAHQLGTFYVRIIEIREN